MVVVVCEVAELGVVELCVAGFVVGFIVVDVGFSDVVVLADVVKLSDDVMVFGDDVVRAVIVTAVGAVDFGVTVLFPVMRMSEHA